MTIRDIIVSFGVDVDRNSEKQAESSIKGLKSMATKLLGGIAVVFSVAKLKSFASDCVEAASNVQEMENKFDVVFDNMRDEVDQWAEDFADAVGRNKNTIKTYLADQQNLLVGFGMTREAGAKLSEEMTSLALDIASFANQDEDIAVNAMTKAVMGESEAAKTLGAVLNDTTRAETMLAMGLSGNYNSLDQLTKMQVNYNTILRQSPDAIGDCVRSMDSYEARTRQLNSAVAEFKEFVGGQLLPIFAVFLGWFTKGVKVATQFAKAVFLDKEENNRLLRVFDRIHAVIKKLHPAMERFAQSMGNGISKATDMVKGIAERLGGMDQLLKVLAITAGAFFIVMNWQKIADGAKAFLKMVSGITKLFSPANLKILRLVALVVLLALIVEDFVHFMLGNDSVIGHCFEQAGIDADKMRGKIKNIWENLKSFFVGIWNAIKTAAAPIIEQIGKMIERVFGIDLFSGLGSGIAVVIELLERITGALAKSKGLQDFLGKAVVAIVAVVAAVKIAIPVIKGIIALVGVAKGVIAGVGAVIGFLTSPIGLVIAAIAALIAIGVLLYQHWDEVKAYAISIWTTICDFFAEAWESIKGVFSSALESVKSLWESAWTTVSSFFSDVWNRIVTFVDNALSNMLNSVTSRVASIKDAIVNGFNAAIDWIRALPAQAVQWGADFINGLKNGILSGVQGIVSAVKGIGDRIKSFLHFSVPDEGPLTDYESWMPDFMGGLAKGISDNEDTVLDKVKGLASGISVLMKGATASAATAGTTAVSNRTSNVTQNVNIDNTYNGGSMETQKNVSKAMKKSAVDATTQMARGLAYARG